MCLRKSLSPAPSDPAAKTSVRLWSLYQMLPCAPQTISGIFLSSKTVAIAESEPENAHTLCCPGQEMLFLFFLLC